MWRFWRTASLIFGCTFGLTFFAQLPSLFSQATVSNVFVRAYTGRNASILSFTAGNPSPNTVFATTYASGQFGASRPSGQALSITPDGRWLIVQPPMRGNTFNGLPTELYARTGMPFSNPPIYALATSTSADGRYLFYISVDSAGHDETYNFLNLATGQHVELQVGPLNNPPSMSPPGALTNCAPNTITSFGNCQGATLGFGNGSRFGGDISISLRQSLPEFAMPVRGWTLNTSNVVFVTSDPSTRYLQSSKYFSLDLSGINWSGSRSYALPAQKALPIPPQNVGTAYLSPDGKLLAYLFNASGKDNGLAFADSMAILNLATGNSTIFHAKLDDVITNLQWDSGDSVQQTLFFAEMPRISDQETSRTFQLFQADVTGQESKILSINTSTLSASSSGYGYYAYYSGFTGLDFIVCGKTLFYDTDSTLHSIALDDPGNDKKLFSASRLNILSCAPGYAWNAARARTVRSSA